MIAELLALADDALAAAIRGRERGMLYAPRPPFHVGVAVGDDGDAAEPFAVVLGPHTRRGYTWRGDVVVDEAGKPVATRVRTGRVSIDARTLADAAFADATSGAWLVAHTSIVAASNRWQRLVPGFTVGRGSDAHMRTLAGTVARQHCRFDVVDRPSATLRVAAHPGEAGAIDGRWYVEDLRTTNGTWIDRVRVDRAALDHGTMIEAAGHTLEFRATLSPARRVIDPTDEASWSRLFLDRIELDALAAQLAYAAAEPARIATVRAGATTWQLATAEVARDARWLFASDDDARVWFDVVVAREGEELPTPIVGDDCACFVAGANVVVVARVDRLVARLVALGPSRRADDLAALVATRAAT